MNCLRVSSIPVLQKFWCSTTAEARDLVRAGYVWRKRFELSEPSRSAGNGQGSVARRTLVREQALLRRHGRIIEPGALRLQDCRSRYNLLHFQGHNALLDALATAELLIVMAAHRSVGETFSLSELL